MPYGAGQNTDGLNDLEVVPDGTTLTCQLIGAKEKEKPFKDDYGNPVRVIQYVFKVVEAGKFQNRKVFGETPLWWNQSPNCKLRNWVKAIFAADELPDDFVFELEDLLDAFVDVEVAVKTKITENEERHWNQVRTIRPAAAPVEEPAF